MRKRKQSVCSPSYCICTRKVSCAKIKIELKSLTSILDRSTIQKIVLLLMVLIWVQLSSFTNLKLTIPLKLLNLNVNYRCKLEFLYICIYIFNDCWKFFNEIVENFRFQNMLMKITERNSDWRQATSRNFLYYSLEYLWVISSRYWRKTKAILLEIFYFH